MTRLGHSVPKINPCAAPAGRRRACGSVQLFGGIRTSAFAPLLGNKWTSAGSTKPIYEYTAYHYFGRFLLLKDSRISFSVIHGWSAFWRGRPWRMGRLVGRMSLAGILSRS